MATTTFLSNATINITQGATTTDLSDQANSVAITVGYDPLEITAFNGGAGTQGHSFTKGLQTVEVAITFYLSYGASEVEAILYSCLGAGNTTLVISPDTATEGPSNPEYTINGCMLASFTPINSKVGEIAVVEATFTGGTFSRDITP